MAHGNAGPGELYQEGADPGGADAPAEAEIFEALPLPAALIDEATRRIISANSALARLLGCDRQTLAGADFEDVFKPNEAAQAAEEPGRVACVLKRTDRPRLRASVSFTPLKRESSGGMLAAVHSTEEPRPGSARRFEFDENYFRDLFESANELMVAHDLKGRIIAVNRAWLDAFGIGLKEALQSSIFDLVDKEYLVLFKAKIEQKLKLGGFTAPYEVLWRGREGRPLWLELSTRLIAMEGEPIGVQGIGRDITSRKRNDEALRDSQRRAIEQQKLLEMMIEQSPYAIAFWNPDGGFFHGNEALVKLFGALPPQGYNILHDPQFKEAGLTRDIQRAFNGQPVHIDPAHYDAGKLSGKDYAPRPVWVRLTFFPIIDARGAIIRIVSFFRDITGQVAAEEAKDKLEGRLLDSQKLEAIGTLAGGVAHDFNNLLTGVCGYIDLIRSMTGPEIHPYLDKAELVVQRGTDLTRQLLAYARKSRIEPQVHDMNSTVKEVEALIRQTMDRRIEVSTRLSPVSATVNADPGQMSQVLLNLCVNARDAVTDKLRSVEGQPHPDWQPMIKIRTRQKRVDEAYCQAHPDSREGNFVRVSVSDNGVGMDEETKRRIFEPFFTTKAVGKGTGLGLATLFGIVKQHDGWVEVESAPGEGTTFHAFLPAIDAVPMTLSDAAASLKVRGGKETILLADDEEMIRDLVGNFLRSKGYEVLIAIDGQDCLDTFMREYQRIDLAVLDLTMPRLSGKEVLPRLLERKPTLKVVAISGYSFNDSWMDIQDLGAVAFV